MPSCDACSVGPVEPMTLKKLMLEAASIGATALNLQAEAETMDGEAAALENAMVGANDTVTNVLWDALSNLQKRKSELAGAQVTVMPIAELRAALDGLGDAETFLLEKAVAPMSAKEAYVFVVNYLKNKR